MRTCLIAVLPLLLPLAATAQGLPDGDGRAEVEAVCSGCHRTNLINRSLGYDRAGWDTLTAAMIDLSADPELQETVLDYLAEHFPDGGERPGMRGPGITVPGPLALGFETWIAPTPGQRARDPVEGPGGMIWWVGQWGDILGRIDPVTGTMSEFDLPAGAKPHSVNADPDGAIWYTGNGNGTMGRLDPVSGEVEEFPMPDPAARDPHTAEFDADGILWFTLQHSNMIGRLDPATGEVRLAASPVAGSKPYGIKVAADGTLWVACNGAPCLLKVDPATMEIAEIPLPDAGTTVRRLDIDADGVIWWVNSGLGRLGRYDPASGVVTEWPSPSGPDSHPYAIAVFGGAVWYNESGVRPDMLVRFEPVTETFQSWPIPSGDLHAGILRHMRVSGDRAALLIHQTATGAIMRVTVE